MGKSTIYLHGFQNGLPGKYIFPCAGDLQVILAGSMRQLVDHFFKGLMVLKGHLAYEVGVLPLCLLFLSAMIRSDGLVGLTLSNDDYQSIC